MKTAFTIDLNSKPSQGFIIFPWESPCLYKVSVCACAGVSNSLRPRGLQPVRLLCPCNFPSKNIDPRFEPMFLTSPALASGFFTTVPPGKPLTWGIHVKKLVCLHFLFQESQLSTQKGREKIIFLLCTGMRKYIVFSWDWLLELTVLSEEYHGTSLLVCSC